MPITSPGREGRAWRGRHRLHALPLAEIRALTPIVRRFTRSKFCPANRRKEEQAHNMELFDGLRAELVSSPVGLR